MRTIGTIFKRRGKALILMLLGSFCVFQATAQQTTLPPDTTHIDSTNIKTSIFLRNLIEDIEDEAGSEPVDLEIDGLIVDETVTKSGRDFYQVFYSLWEPPPNASNFTIRISEKPARGIATVVMIDINDVRIIETPLQPRYDILEAIAEQATRSIYNYLLNYEQIQQQLSGDDLSGSGIF
jgi:curli production assembly/transport component CsgE